MVIMAIRKYENRVIADPKIMAGKAIIKGTRITVELVLRQLAQGITAEEILGNYPHLTREDIRAAIAYASELVEEEAVYPLVHNIHGKAQALTR